MEKLKRIVVAVLLMTLSMCVFAGCAKKRGPYDVKKVTYVIYGGDINHDEVFVITSDYKVTQYSVDPEADRRYDYLKGDFPSEDRYKVKEYETDELSWTSMVNVLTRVRFMDLKEDISSDGSICDACTYYIMVETTDAKNISGGYVAGYDDDPDSRRFEEARQIIESTIKDR